MAKTLSSAKNQNFFEESDNVLRCYLKKISKCRTLSPLEERKFAREAQNGDENAKRELVQANLKLVVTIARKAIHMSHLPMIDLIQEGNLGLGSNRKVQLAIGLQIFDLCKLVDN